MRLQRGAVVTVARPGARFMADKLFTVPLDAVRSVVGRLEPASLMELDLGLKGWLDLV